MTSLEARAQQHLEIARTSDRGLSSELIVSDGPLRQSILALSAGAKLAEHNSPPAASIQMITGKVHVTAADEVFEFAAGDIAALTHVRHGVTAIEDSCFLLTTVTSVDLTSWDGSEK